MNVEVMSDESPVATVGFCKGLECAFTVNRFAYLNRVWLSFINTMPLNQTFQSFWSQTVSIIIAHEWTRGQEYGT